MAAQEVLEEPSEPISYKTWILKVSIHCEGCKRKVKKILQQVQGVFKIDIDTRQQKVTVIGDVDAGTLLRKLIKAGKHAELWPLEVEEQEQKQGKPKSKEKTTGQGGDEGACKIAGNEKEVAKPPTVKQEQVFQEPANKNNQGGADGDLAGKVRKSAGAGGGTAPRAQEPSNNHQGGAATKAGGESCGAAKTSGEAGSVAVKVIEVTAKTCTVDQVVEESKLEEKKPDNDGRAAAGQQPVAVEKKVGENNATNSAGKVGGNDGGNSGKKKKKKGQNGNKVGGEQLSGTPASIGSENHEDGPQAGSVPANHSPPHHPGYDAYPPQYYGPQPVYAVSYNTSHPASRTAAYYAAPPPNSYVYEYSSGYSVVPEREAPPPQSDLDSYPRQPLDSFEIFSDENPNGCSVM